MLNKRIIRLLIIGIAGVLMIVLLISLLLPGHVMTSKWVIVATGKEKALNSIRDLNRWKEWNGLLIEANQLQVIQKPVITDTGSLLFWKDQRDQNNEIRVTVNNDTGLVANLRIGSQRPMTSGFSVEKRQRDSVQVVWYIIEDLKWYPWEKFYGMMAQEMKGPLMQESLDRLKQQLQQ